MGVCDKGVLRAVWTRACGCPGLGPLSLGKACLGVPADHVPTWIQDMRFNCRFMDIMRTDPSGARLVDFRRFNTVIQNTIMPVSYGLTFEETVIVNGPDVHKPTPTPGRGGSGGRRSNGPSRTSSRASLPAAAAARSAVAAAVAEPDGSKEHLKLSPADRGDNGNGARRLWRRPGGGGGDTADGEAGSADALGTRGLQVRESDGSGLPDADALANSGGSSDADSGSPPPMQGKVGSLLPEPDGNMGGVTFNRLQVRTCLAVRVQARVILSSCVNPMLCMLRCATTIQRPYACVVCV